MAQRKIIAEEFEGMLNAMFPGQNVHPTLRILLRQSFFGGAAILNRIIGELSAGDQATDGDVSVLQDLSDEISEFLQHVNAVASLLDLISVNRDGGKVQ